MADAVLVVDDEKTLRETLHWRFGREGWRVQAAGSGDEALALVRTTPFDVVVADLILPGLDGIELLEQTAALRPSPSVILMTAYATVNTAIDALRLGATDYVRKPFKLDEIAMRVKGVLAARRAVPRRRPGGVRPAADAGAALRGTGVAMAGVRKLIAKSAACASHVLVTGESGTGKELVARAIHDASPRRAAPFVPVNGAAIPETLFESQLFGHARGAFTGAVDANPGLFVAAHHGTLVLDEVGELPPALQVKLLRVIEEKAVWPVGGCAPVRIDTRIVASTNRDLGADVAAGRFRHDLYYRLNVVHIALPPLRDRREDIPDLVAHFIARFRDEFDWRVRAIDPRALEVLIDHHWPGNVRELAHVIERAMVVAEGEHIGVDDLPEHVRAKPARMSLRDAVRDFERRHIEDMLRRSQFDKREAARRLGLSVASLYRKLQEAA